MVRPKGKGRFLFFFFFLLGEILKAKKGGHEIYIIQTQHVYDRCTEYTWLLGKDNDNQNSWASWGIMSTKLKTNPPQEKLSKINEI